MRLAILEKQAAMIPSDSAEWDEYRTSRSPVVRKLVEKREQEIHKGLVTTGLTSAGLGLGVLGLRNLAIDPTAQQSLSNFLNFDKVRGAAGETFGAPGRNSVTEAMRGLSEHSALSSGAMQSKFFGMAPDSILKAVRNMPWVKGEDRWNQGSQDHYDSFKKGPLTGMVRQLEEQLVDNGLAGPEGKWKGALGFTRGAVNDLIKERAGIKDYLDSSTASGYSEASGPALDPTKQLEIMKALGPDLESKYTGVASYIPGTDSYNYTKHFRPFATSHLGFLPDNSVKKYREKLLGMPMAIHAAMGPVGWAALLGGAGLTGYGAYRWLKNRRRQKDAEKGKAED